MQAVYNIFLHLFATAPLFYHPFPCVFSVSAIRKGEVANLFPEKCRAFLGRTSAVFRKKAGAFCFSPMSFGRAAEVFPGGKVGLGGEKCPVLFGGIPGNAYLCTAKRKKELHP